MRIRFTEFAPKFLDGLSADRQELSFGVSDHRAAIDEVDHEILSSMSTELGISQRDLATKLGLNTSTLHYRLKQLAEKNILLGHSYIIDPHVIGLRCFLLLVDAKGISQDLRDKLFDY